MISLKLAFILHWTKNIDCITYRVHLSYILTRMLWCNIYTRVQKQYKRNDPNYKFPSFIKKYSIVYVLPWVVKCTREIITPLEILLFLKYLCKPLVIKTMNPHHLSNKQMVCPKVSRSSVFN